PAADARQHRRRGRRGGPRRAARARAHDRGAASLHRGERHAPEPAADLPGLGFPGLARPPILRPAMAPLHSGAHRPRARRGAALAAVLALLAAPRPALAHAIVLDSTPAAGSVVPGPDVALEVRFNCRIDGERSQLSLLSEDGRDREIER